MALSFHTNPPFEVKSTLPQNASGFQGNGEASISRYHALRIVGSRARRGYPKRVAPGNRNPSISVLTDGIWGGSHGCVSSRFRPAPASRQLRGRLIASRDELPFGVCRSYHAVCCRQLKRLLCDLLFPTGFARRASFIAATATAIKTIRSTMPYITKTIQGLPHSTFRRSLVGQKQSRVAATAARVIQWSRCWWKCFPPARSCHQRRAYYRRREYISRSRPTNAGIAIIVDRKSVV
jgi:hypothetical protein